MCETWNQTQGMTYLLSIKNESVVKSPVWSDRPVLSSVCSTSFCELLCLLVTFTTGQLWSSYWTRYLLSCFKYLENSASEKKSRLQWAQCVLSLVLFPKLGKMDLVTWTLLARDRASFVLLLSHSCETLALSNWGFFVCPTVVLIPWAWGRELRRGTNLRKGEYECREKSAVSLTVLLPLVKVHEKCVRFEERRSE